MAKTKKTIKKTVEKVQKQTHGISDKQTTSKRGGSKSQYGVKIEPNLADIERYHRMGVTEAQLCAYYRVSKTQWYQYKKDHPELTETLFRAKCMLQTELINKAYEVAVGGTYIETITVEYYKQENGVKTITGGKTTVHEHYQKPDAGMLQFLLINRFPDDFARDPHAVELRKKALELAEKGATPSTDWEGV